MAFVFNTISETEILNSPGGRMMMDAINYSGEKHLIVTGCPGSGKTTVTLMRAAKLSREKKNVLVLTYQNLLKISLVNIATPDMKWRITGFYEWYVKNTSSYLEHSDTCEKMIEKLKNVGEFDEILIDEGQDFEKRILKTIGNKTKRINVGADNAQKLHSKGTNAQDIISIVEDFGGVQRVNLQYNYRNNFETYNFARFFLPLNERANNLVTLDRMPKGRGIKPTVFMAKNEQERHKILKTRLNDAGDVNIAILVYSIEEVEYYYKLIPTLGDFKCSKYYNEMPKAEKRNVELYMENIIVTTYKSAKGLEFQVVIMPNMETAMDEIYKTPEHYYVGCTRAKEQLFLIANIHKPKYLNNFDSSTYEFVEDAGLDNSNFFNDEDDDLPF
ncbi:AAA family ATPase [Rufibacter glacialis]|uniref:DNA 3'-5' helicase II n=1 Tax=Rufibacter glacialis TaxID=1259555 RepID=A0A5M8Q8Y9_9BACT|nr:AAA family ATPase [Rufibacter glacialis]KAA6432397.1 AAA family ATPase [Rufibacter glacialis]GGK78336.1 hypothetical protein GCM10011405_27720 [Rufibacter glacialis]